MLALLALLAVPLHRGISRDRLALYLWPDSDTQRARGALKQTLHVARQQLGSTDAVVGTSELRLNPAVIESDLAAFITALDNGEAEHAVALYKGPFLDGFYIHGAHEFERWVDSQRLELARRYVTAVERLATDASDRGDHTTAVRWWRVRHEDEPLGSRVTLRLMHALDDAGDRQAAIRCAHEHATALRTELGSPADPDVTAFAEQLHQRSARKTEPVADVAPDAQVINQAIERGSNDAEAYDLYLQARHRWRLRTRDGFLSARTYYEEAVDRDPAFANAWAGLAAAYVNLSNFGYMDTSEALALAERSADRAIALNPALAEAHAAKGFVQASRVDFVNAEETFRKTIAINPDYSFGHHYYTLLLLMLGRTDDALAQNREALRCDPLSRAANATTGIVFCQRGDYASAEKELRRALELAPEFPLTLYFLGVVQIAQGAMSDALELLEQTMRHAPGFTGAPGALAYLYRTLGRQVEADSLLDTLRTGTQTGRDRVNLALALGALGSLDEAFALMGQLAWEVPSLIELRANPLLQPLRADGRYQLLLRKIGTGV